MCPAFPLLSFRRALAVGRRKQPVPTLGFLGGTLDQAPFLPLAGRRP